METKPNPLEAKTELAERQKASEPRAGGGSKLGFLAGGRHWLTDLGQVNEVVTAARLTPVPWAKPWFLGVASVRGVIYGCSDLAAFLGQAAAGEGGIHRLLLVHPRFGVNAALAIDRAVGLRNTHAMSRVARTESDPPWVLARWEDADGTTWTELGIEQLVISADFQQAGSETL